jgi:hypothetical protein
MNIISQKQENLKETLNFMKYNKNFNSNKDGGCIQERHSKRRNEKFHIAIICEILDRWLSGAPEYSRHPPKEKDPDG